MRAPHPHDWRRDVDVGARLPTAVRTAPRVVERHRLGPAASSTRSAPGALCVDTDASDLESVDGLHRVRAAPGTRTAASAAGPRRCCSSARRHRRRRSGGPAIEYGIPPRPDSSTSALPEVRERSGAGMEMLRWTTLTAPASGAESARSARFAAAVGASSGRGRTGPSRCCRGSSRRRGSSQRLRVVEPVAARVDAALERVWPVRVKRQRPHRRPPPAAARRCNCPSS